jgi:putative phosphoesterase
MMRIGIFSDVHADIQSLEKALALLRSRGVDQLLCGGDLVDKGDQADAVVALLQQQSIPCVQGNHDADAASLSESMIDWLLDNGHDVEPSGRKLLKRETLAYLRQLPRQLRFMWEGKRVLLTHATPWSLDTYVFPQAYARVFHRIADEARADVVILGHTHEPMIVDVWQASCRIINPGSVYGVRGKGEMGGSGTCGILTLPNGSFDVLHIHTGEYARPPYINVRP